MKIAHITQSAILVEGVRAHGNELLAYIMVVADEYHKLPKVDPDEIWRWEELMRHGEKLMRRVSGKIKVEFVTGDPYKTMRDMMYDIIVNKRMKIYKTEPDSSQEGSHPAMPPEGNDMFRAVHDYLGHFAPNAKFVADYIKRNGITTNDSDKFRQIRFSRNAFTIRGEMNTFVSHAKMAPKDVVPVLFTEIVGQICTYFVTGNFTENKVALIDGIDYDNLGMFKSSSLERRKKKYLDLIDDASVDKITIEMGAVIDKATIRWNLISHGEGKAH